MPEITMTDKPMKAPITFSLDEQELPDIKQWKVGGKYTITMEVEQISLDKGVGLEEGKGPLQARFKVLSASTGKKAEESEDSEEEYEDEEGEDEADTKVMEESPKHSMMSEHTPMRHGMPSVHAMVIEISKKKGKQPPPSGKIVQAFTKKMMG